MFHAPWSLAPVSIQTGLVAVYVALAVELTRLNSAEGVPPALLPPFQLPPSPHRSRCRPRTLDDCRVHGRHSLRRAPFYSHHHTTGNAQCLHSIGHRLVSAPHVLLTLAVKHLSRSKPASSPDYSEDELAGVVSGLNRAATHVAEIHDVLGIVKGGAQSS